MFWTALCAVWIYLATRSVLGSPVKHIILVVMENRSFDSLLGSVQLQEMEIMTANPAPNGSMIYAKPTTDMVSYFDPGHMISDVTEQIYGTIDPKDFDHPSMSGFALNAARKARKIMFNQDRAMREVMNYYPTGSLPILQTLAQEYTVFDRWFASVPGPTFPNRHFIHCATSGGFGRNRLRIGGFPMKTIYDSMNENNRTWKYYFSGGVPFLALYNRMLRLQNLRNFRTLNGFFQDAKTGSFPDFTIVDPNFEKTDEHPPHSFTAGEEFLRKVYNAVRTSPAWNETALLVTYDEHGGFYDHVPPPTNVPIPDEASENSSTGFKFDRLGVRVPTILISPWVRKGGVVSYGQCGEIFEHSSIAATIKKMFGLDDFLTKRDAWAATFDYVLEGGTFREDCLPAFEVM